MKWVIKNEYGKFGYEEYEGNPFIHLTLNKWSHTLFKNYYLPMWAKILEEFKEMGYENVFAITNEDEEFIRKFQSMFGMEEIAREDGYVCTWREL